MKIKDFKNKKTAKWVVGILILILLVVLFFKGLQGKSVWNFNNHGADKSNVDIANSEDYQKYEGSVEAKFEGEHKLIFSFLHRKDLDIVQGKGVQARWFKLVDASSTNSVTLYFTYEGGRGFTADDYVNTVLKTNDSIKVEDIKFADDDTVSVKHVLDEVNNSEYYVESIKATDGEAWLAIVENNNFGNIVDQSVAKDLMRSFKVE